MKLLKLHSFFMIVLWLISINSFANADIAVKGWITDDGARVLFYETHKLPMLEVRVVFNAGSEHDGDNFGLAYFTNAMLSEGTKNLNADQIALQFEKIGARFYNNSDLILSSVGFLCLTKPKILNDGLKLLSAVLSESVFPVAELDRLKEQVLATIEQDKTEPSFIASEEFGKVIYGDHPYAHLGRGTPDTIKELTAKHLKEFYNKYYTSKNATVIMVGDISQEYARDIANKVTASLSQGKSMLQPSKKINDPKAKRVHIDFLSLQTSVIIGHVGIDRSNKDYFSLLLGNYILGGPNLVSNLSQELREKRGLVYGVKSDIDVERDRGVFDISFATSYDKTQEAIDIVMMALEDFIENGPAEEQLSDAKNNIVSSFLMDLDKNFIITKHMLDIATYDLPLDYLNNFAEKINSITLDEVKEAFKRHIDLEKMVIVTVGKSSN